MLLWVLLLQSEQFRVDPDLALVVSAYGSSAPMDAVGRGPALAVASAVVPHVAPASAVVVPLAAPIPAPVVAPAAPIHAPVMPPAVEAADLGTDIEGPVAAAAPPGFLPVQLNELPISQHNVHVPAQVLGMRHELGLKVSMFPSLMQYMTNVWNDRPTATNVWNDRPTATPFML